MHTLAGQQMLDNEINRQAAMIAYIGDFKFMMLVTLSVVPLLLLLRNPHRAPSRETQMEGAVEAALD